MSVIRRVAPLGLLLACLGLQGCLAVGVAKAGAGAVGTSARVISSTGDVVFDHDGDGR